MKSEDLPKEWGYLDVGAEVVDSINRGVYHVYHQEGSVVLIDRTTGYRIAFEAVEDIDHNRFKINRAK